MQRPASFIALASLVLGLLAGCAYLPHYTRDDSAAAAPLPAEVAMSEDAGRGNLLMVPLRLEDGEEMEFMVDTGASATVFDASLESRLGKKLGTMSVQRWDVHENKSLYATPKLFLGGTPLKTGDRVITFDFKGLSFQTGKPVKGVLGMDALKHYCVQLDFVAGKIRFLDDKLADKSSWGRAFPIVALNEKDWRPAVAENLCGVSGVNSLIDSGYGAGGWLMPKYFQQWTNEASPSVKGGLHSPDGMFGGERYPQLSLDEKNVESDGLGLDFLARHLVTLDFPGHTLYLKRTSAGPLPPVGLGAVTLFLKALKAKGELPGWTKDERGEPRGGVMDSSGDSGTFVVQKNGESSLYHYQVNRVSKDAPWQLQRAWRTDAQGNTVEEFPVP